MFKRLNLAVALAAAAAVVGIVVAMSRTEAREGIAIQGKAITIYGRGYTLARLAQAATELGQGELFTYDPKKREAVANASLIIRGGLQVGDPADPKLGETLLLNTVVCGDLQVQVARGGELRLHHSVLQTVSQVITEEKCSRGYYFFSDGKLVAADSRILYMSGARGETVTPSAEVDVRRTAFALADDCAFHVRNADGDRLAVRDSQFLCEGRYGVWVEGSGGAPVRFERCRLFGSEADLYLSGSRPAVELVDCQFTRGKVRFQHNSGRLTLLWTVQVKVVERGTGKPVAGIEVVATSTGQGPAEAVRGRSGADGLCPLVLTEGTATPDRPAGGDPAHRVTPHRIVALAPSGKPLAEASGCEAQGLHGAVTLDVAPADLASR